MLPVMPMEPTRPMPSRSSGTKDMAMPHLADVHGVHAHQLLRLAVVGIVIGHAALGDGVEARDGLQKLPLAAAGNAGNAQHLAGVDGEASHRPDA